MGALAGIGIVSARTRSLRAQSLSARALLRPGAPALPIRSALSSRYWTGRLGLEFSGEINHQQITGRGVAWPPSEGKQKFSGNLFALVAYSSRYLRPFKALSSSLLLYFERRVGEAGEGGDNDLACPQLLIFSATLLGNTGIMCPALKRLNSKLNSTKYD